jgi:hypothetical protein
MHAMIDRARGGSMDTLTGRYVFVPSADEANPMTELCDGLAPVVYRANRPNETCCAYRGVAGKALG